MLGLFKKKEATPPTKEQQINEIIKKNEMWRGIRDDKEINKQISLDILNLEYKDINDRTYELSSYEMYHKLYSKAINQKNIFNQYSEQYINLCEKYLILLPKKIEYERQREKIEGYGNSSICNRLLKQYILLLDKQENYIKEGELIHYLMGLGITEDGTKGGLKTRAEKLIPKIKEERKTIE